MFEMTSIEAEGECMLLSSVMQEER